MPLYFEWDDKKAANNLTKHAVSFGEATTVFADSQSLTIPDPSHSELENRFITIGCSTPRKVIVVVHTERGDNIRIISARSASKRERIDYEKNT